MSQEIKLVLAQCSHCGINTTGRADWKGLTFCSQVCMDSFNENKNAAYLDAEASKFLAKNEEIYYPCPYNQRLMSETLAAWKLVGTAENLESAYLHLLAEKKILFKLTRKEIDAMDSPTFDAREKIDPQLGGALAEVEARGNAKFDAPQKWTMGGTGGWEKMAAANLADRQRQADNRAIARRRS